VNQAILEILEQLVRDLGFRETQKMLAFGRLGFTCAANQIYWLALGGCVVYGLDQGAGMGQAPRDGPRGPMPCSDRIAPIIQSAFVSHGRSLHCRRAVAGIQNSWRVTGHGQ
jgi:hypothetical protein